MKKSLLCILLLCIGLLAANDAELFWNTYTAALRGDREAQFQTGVMFERGIGVDVNQSEAAKWYEKAAIQGHKDAQFNIGIMYASGRGIEKNEQFAMMWLASSAKQGDKESRILLLTIIDGKLKSNSQSQKHENDNVQFIKPIRFETKNEALVCNRTGGMGECHPLTEGKIFTSKSKQGNYYKISGMVTSHGWKAYEGDGFIEIEMVELK